MRRSLPAEPFCANATWTRRLSLGGAALASLAVGAAQRPLLEPRAALAMLAGGLLLAGFAWIEGLSSAGVMWRTGERGVGRTIVGLALASLTLAYPAYLATAALQSTAPRDLSTDPADPPRFSSSAKARLSRGTFGDGPAIVASSGPPRPDLAPILLDIKASEALGAGVRAIANLHWHIVDIEPARSGPATLDATTYSTVMRLPEEIAIRIKPVAGQTRIDIRSTSRFGLPDLGDNARNIKALSDAVAEQQDEK